MSKKKKKRDKTFSSKPSFSPLKFRTVDVVVKVRLEYLGDI